MNLKRKFWSGNNRFRLMLTLDLAVMLPAAALIYVNFAHLKAIRRDKVLEAAFHRDFQGMHKRNRLITFYPDQVKRAGSYSYMTTAFFCLPQLSKDRSVLGGVSFDPNYLKQTFFPEMLEELIAHKLTEGGGNQLAMMVYPADYEGG